MFPTLHSDPHSWVSSPNPDLVAKAGIQAEAEPAGRRVDGEQGGCGVSTGVGSAERPPLLRSSSGPSVGSWGQDIFL